MNYGVDGADYASHLIAVARALNQRRSAWFPAPAMARPSSLERRVRAMLNDRLNRTPISGSRRAGVFAALLTMTVAVAAAQNAYFSLSGTVSDDSGRGVPGTTLILVNEQRQMKYEIKSNELGRFEFVGIAGQGSMAFWCARSGSRRSKMSSSLRAGICSGTSRSRLGRSRKQYLSASTRRRRSPTIARHRRRGSKRCPCQRRRNASHLQPVAVSSHPRRFATSLRSTRWRCAVRDRRHRGHGSAPRPGRLRRRHPGRPMKRIRS